VGVVILKGLAAVFFDVSLAERLK